jgi:hypothetical protein
MKIKWTRYDSVNVASPSDTALPNFTSCIAPGAAIKAGQIKVQGGDSVEVNADGLKEMPKDLFWFTDLKGITYLSVPVDLFTMEQCQ